jgi:hypothetical protein
MKVIVSPVRTRSDCRDFVTLPLRIYDRDSHWVAPIFSSVRKLMDPSFNPFHREAFVEHFVARDSTGQCVGRIAAIIHPAYVDRYGPKAFFGFFEAVDDPHVAKLLLASVERWADERGLSSVIGPCSYTTTQDTGMLVEGFEQPPAILQTYNPPYYVGLLESAGYQPAFHMLAFTARRGADVNRAAGVIGRSDMVLDTGGLSVRSIDMGRYEEELERLRLVYNRAFSAHPQTVAVSREVFAAQADDLRAIVDQRLVRVVEKDGRPVAFLVAVPNVNEVLARVRGRVTLGLLLGWRRFVRQIRSIVIIMIGADPVERADGGSRRRPTTFGIGACIAAEVARAISEGQYDTAHTTWVHEGNRAMRMMMSAVGLKPSKRYAVYERVLQ